ncbi:ZIP family metal transporter [Eubacterium aggregans]|uniref:ZIP family metal transporter n=1 Tax=Eubacterium aggregans TaxID=81409 RepID=UPI003F3D95D5
MQHHHDLSPQEAVYHTRDRLFYITLIAFGLHSLFELISVLIAGDSDMTVGMLLALVIAIHNIPIGFIIVAQLDALGIAPRKTKKGMVALVVAQSALAILCYWLLSFIITAAIQGILLAVTAGVMLYLLFDELLPGIYREEDQHHINYAILAGALVMLLFLNLVGG